MVRGDGNWEEVDYWYRDYRFRKQTKLRFLDIPREDKVGLGSCSRVKEEEKEKEGER